MGEGLDDSVSRSEDRIELGVGHLNENISVHGICKF